MRDQSYLVLRPIWKLFTRMDILRPLHGTFLKSCEGYWSCQRLPSHVVSEFKVMFEKLRSDATPGSKIGPRTPYPPYTKRASYLPEYRERDWDKHSSLNLNALVLFSLNCLYSHVCWNGLFWQIGQFRGIEYSASVADFFDDINMRPAEKWHPKIKNVVYWGMWQFQIPLSINSNWK